MTLFPLILSWLTEKQEGESMEWKLRSGFVLVLIIFLLAALSAMGLQLSFSAHQSATLADNALDRTRAQIVARSGFHKAIAGCYASSLKLRSDLPLGEDWHYHGEDLDANGEVSWAEDQLGNGDSVPDIDSCPLDRALRPSLAVPNLTGLTADKTVVEGREVGYSWKDPLGNLASLNIQTVNSLVDLNGGIERTEDSEVFDLHYGIDVTGSSAASVDYAFNQPTVSMINSLGDYLKYRFQMTEPEETFDFSRPIDDPVNLESGAFKRWIVKPTPRLGTRVVMHRPEQGYQHVNDVKDIVIAWAEDEGVDPDWVWRRCRSLMTTQAKRDLHTRIWRQYGLPYHRLSTEDHYLGHLVPLGFRDQDQARLYLRTRSYRHPRMPVDINSAPEPVLAALFHSARSVWLRREIMPGEGSLEQCHVQLVAYPKRSHLLENGLTAGMELTGSSGINGLTSFNGGGGGGLGAHYSRALLSMTESIQMARELIRDRTDLPLDSYRRLHDWLIKRTCGYDHRQISSMHVQYQGGLDLAHPQHALWFPRFHDAFDLNQRFRILADILNPNGDLRHFCRDEALPLTTQKKEFRYVGVASDLQNGTDFITNAMSRGRVGTLGKDHFDKSYPHISGAEATFAPTGRFQVESLGRVVRPGGQLAARMTISLVVNLWDRQVLTSQKDFVEALRSGNVTGFEHEALENDWITYPEIIADQTGSPAFGSEPAQWDGQLALRPVTPNLRMGMSFPLGMHITLNAHQEAVPANLAVQKSPQGPVIQKLSSKMVPSMTTLSDPYETGLWPMYRSLLTPSYDSSGSELDDVSQLTPGGGYQAGSVASLMDNHMTSYLPQRTENVRVTGMVLPDRSPSTGTVLGEVHDGAVSFWFKPHSMPMATVPQYGDEDSKNRLWSRTPYCLFDYTFFVQDNALKSMVESELQAMGYSSVETFAGVIRGNLRLMHGTMWNSITNDGRNVRDRLRFSALNQRRHKVTNTRFVNRWYQKDVSNNLVVPSYVLSPNSSSGNVALFPHTWGAQAADGTIGHLNNGLEVNDWLLAREDYVPYVSDKLWLEFRVTMVTDAEVVVDAGSGMSYKRLILDDKQIGYQDNGGYLDLYENFLQSVTASDVSMFSGESYTAKSTDSHTVVKSIRLDYPIVLNPTSEHYGRGPTDDEGLPMPMLNAGRWHHLMIAWKDMRKMLNLDDPSTRGGQIALYHNGALKKHVPIEQANDPSQGYQYNALMWHTDYSTVYYNARIYRTPLTDAPGDESHDYAGENSFFNSASVGGKSMDIWFPAPDHTHPFLTFQHPWFQFLPPESLSTRRAVIQGFGMESEGYPSPLATGAQNSGAYPQYYFKGSNAHFSGHTTFRTPNGAVVHDNYNVMHHAANKFFFGSAPAGLCQLSGDPIDEGNVKTVRTHKYVTDGTFMDIKMCEAPTTEILDSQGHFLPSIPSFDNASIFPRDANDAADANHNARLFPFRSSTFAQAEGTSLIGFGWTAWLPPFHSFWDDINGQSERFDESLDKYVVIDEPGADGDDQQVLKVTLERNIEDPNLAVNASGWAPSDPAAVLKLEQAHPRFDRNLVMLDQWQKISGDPFGLSLKMDFSVGASGQGRSFTTPLIDDVSFYTVAAGGWRVLSWE